MPKESRRRKQQQIDLASIPIHTNSIDMSSDAIFLIGHLNTSNPFFVFLLSNQLTNESFTKLYQQSQIIGWEQALIDLRKGLAIDERNKPKRLALNRLITECSINLVGFQTEANLIYEQIKNHLTDFSLSVCSISEIYNEVKQWQQLQINRRLFFDNFLPKYNLITLQRIITDRFIYLATSIGINPTMSETEIYQALTELLQHSLIIVEQPSGTDCLAVTKYEKVANQFTTKIKTRTICLLDLIRTSSYLQLHQIGMTLYLKDRQSDLVGDVQSPILWKTRTITSNDNQLRIFSYFELTENDPIKLTKTNSNGKPAYNNNLCQIEYQIQFQIQLNGKISPVSWPLTTQPFGLCSHAKYYPKQLTQVFLADISARAKDITFETHLTILEGFIEQLYQRWTGVPMKTQTKEFINKKLSKISIPFGNSVNALGGDVMFLSFNNYKEVLEKLFLPMKFLGSQPFLCLMYHDNLFRGICGNEIDQTMSKQCCSTPQFMMRFSLEEEQEKSDNPDIIFVIHRDSDLLSKARTTHKYLNTDVSLCICEAVKNPNNQLVIFDTNENHPFSKLQWYYDTELDRDSIIQTIDQTRYFPLKSLLRDVREVTNDERTPVHQMDLYGRVMGKKDLELKAINRLKEEYACFCRDHNIHGDLYLVMMDNTEADGTFFN